MRILFTCRPAYGHLFPLLPLANAARAAGHDVVFGTGEALVPKVRDLGFEVHPAGIGIGEAEAEAKKRHGEDAGFLQKAPHTLAISRPDEVRAAKEPVLRWRSGDGQTAPGSRADAKLPHQGRTLQAPSY